MSQSEYPKGLLDLHKVVLDPACTALYQAALLQCGGQSPWRQRKLAEYRTLLRLTLLSGRIRIMHADLRGDLRVVFAFRTPVPCEPDRHGQLQVADGAVIGLRYFEEAVRLPQPGHAFVQILAPRGVFHSNVATGPQQLCLGAHLHAGIRVTELLLLTYGALTLQSVALDVLDPAGVLNPAAALYFQEHPECVPLTRDAFILNLPEGRPTDQP